MGIFLRTWIIAWVLALPLVHVHPDLPHDHGDLVHAHVIVHTVFASDLSPHTHHDHIPPALESHEFGFVDDPEIDFLLVTSSDRAGKLALDSVCTSTAPRAPCHAKPLAFPPADSRRGVFVAIHSSPRAPPFPLTVLNNLPHISAS